MGDLMGRFQFQFFDQDDLHVTYDGTQLRSLYAYMQHGILGDSVISWIGPCDVNFEHMVDGEDLRDKSEIRGSRMLHLILEKFEARLPEMVATQRLISAICKDLLEDLRHPGDAQGPGKLQRDGDDLFLEIEGEKGKGERGKLSISIATVSPVSGLIHFAINVSNAGTPVKTASLEDLGIEPKIFARELLSRIVLELNSIHHATQKVKWVY
jgi:hypothetical protein